MHLMPLGSVASLLLIGTIAAGQDSTPPAPKAHRLTVTPQGPEDGGDFGPRTPGTRTSGLQEAFDAAKERGMELYIAGGSWTANKTEPVVYFLDQTLQIPWMQNFRLDGGHYVIQYNPKVGDAIVMDSQMSCSYRFGLIVSNGDGAVLRVKPTTAGPDRFQVVTSTELIVNALVGGGGAWPGGEAHKNELDPGHEWKGVGLHLDGEPGSIDANKFTVIETVGCHVGLLLSGKVTRNAIEETNIHLCRIHAIVGDRPDTLVSDNRLEAYMDSQGIAAADGVRLFGRDNLLTLSSSRMAPGRDLILGTSAEGNLITAHRLPAGITNEARRPTNRLVAPSSIVPKCATPPMGKAGDVAVNRELTPVVVRFTDAGQTTGYREVAVDGSATDHSMPIAAGELVILQPGEGIAWLGEAAPQWVWKSVP